MELASKYNPADVEEMCIRDSHIIRDMVDFYKVPVYELNRIKNGADFVTPEGEVIPLSLIHI